MAPVSVAATVATAQEGLNTNTKGSAMEKNPAAVALGRLSAGVGKSYGAAEIARRTKRLLSGAARARYAKKLAARTAARVEAERRKATKRAKHNWDRADKRAAKAVTA